MTDVLANQAVPTSLRVGFERIVASGIDTAAPFTLMQTGSGMTVSQSAGSLVIATGTGTNSETIIRSKRSVSRSFRLRASVQLSQRIANNNFFLEMVDKIGDGLPFVVNSATSVTVSMPAASFNPFQDATAYVGQSVYLGAISLAACPGGRYAIASISGNDITFTVAGFPASGSGTLSLFGWNFHHVLYNGTTATAAGYDTGRNGWASGDTTATINTTAAPGHVIALAGDGAKSTLLDQLAASSTGADLAQRANRIRNMPDNGIELFLQIRALNGTVAPASTTSLTIGFVDLSDFSALPMSLVNVSPMSQNMTIPVAVVSNSASPTGATAAGTNAIGDVGIQYRANATGASSIKHFIAAASTNAQNVKASAGRLLGWYLLNTTITAKFVKLHNTAGTPTAGAGVVMTIGVPANGVAAFSSEGGIAFSTGIGLSATGASPDADATALALGDIVGDLFYA